MVTLWSDGVLAALAYVSALVATLRAGSRLIYLLEHNQIGVMEGPLILGPHDIAWKKSNESLQISPLWELSYAFKQSVLLALDPGSMEYRVLPIETYKREEDTRESYNLSPFPVKITEAENVVDDMEPSADTSDHDGETVESCVDEVIASKSYDKLGQRKSYFLSSLSFGSIVRRIPVARRWVGLSDDSDDEDIWSQDIDDEWDFDSCVSTDLLYNTTEADGRLAEITAYAPGTFADLRSRFGISEKDFRESVLETGPYVSFQSNSKGAARAGGVFFFSRDGAYMIKTIKKEEAQTLIKILPKYHKYMRRNGRRTLLTRFCGMYGVSLGSSGSTNKRSAHKGDDDYIFVVMNSVFPAAASHFISERFDLKGSTVGRECSEEEKEHKGKNAIMKDLDLAREVELVRSLAPPSRDPKYGFQLGAPLKAALLSQLRRDVRLLVNCGVMDYSLLVGIVNMDPHHMDSGDMRALELSEIQESRMELARRAREKQSFERVIFSSIVTPVRILMAPPLFIGRRICAEINSVLSSVLTLPLPYYGADICGVNGGALSLLEGRRLGHRAIYFVGLIDFLQPWTTRKVIERRLKGILGYDMHAISCVPPDEYAERFLDFIDAHIS